MKGIEKQEFLSNVIENSPWKCGDLYTSTCIRNSLSLWVRNPVRSRTLVISIYVPLLSEVVSVDICWTVLKMCVIKVWQSGDVPTAYGPSTCQLPTWELPLWRTILFSDQDMPLWIKGSHFIHFSSWMGCCHSNARIFQVRQWVISAQSKEETYMSHINMFSITVRSSF